MGTTLRVTHTNEEDRTAWMPRYTEFYAVLDGIANKIEESRPALAAEMRKAIEPEQFSYFDLTTLDQKSFHLVAQAIVEIYRETLDAETHHHNPTISINTLAELVALISFDPRYTLDLFPLQGTLVIDEDLTWQAQGWIYVVIMTHLVSVAEHEKRPDVAAYFLDRIFKNTYICDLTKFRDERWGDLSNVMHWLPVIYERSAQHLCRSTRFEKELLPAARQFAEMFLGKYPYNDPELEE